MHKGLFRDLRNHLGANAGPTSILWKKVNVSCVVNLAVAITTCWVAKHRPRVNPRSGVSETRSCVAVVTKSIPVVPTRIVAVASAIAVNSVITVVLVAVSVAIASSVSITVSEVAYANARTIATDLHLYAAKLRVSNTIR